MLPVPSFSEISQIFSFQQNEYLQLGQETFCCCHEVKEQLSPQLAGAVLLSTQLMEGLTVYTTASKCCPSLRLTTFFLSDLQMIHCANQSDD